MPQETQRSTTRVRGFTDPEFDFQLLRQLGSVCYGGASTGESLATAARIDDGDAAGWSAAFAALGARQSADAQRRAAAGHRVSARDRRLQASNSYRAAEYFARLGTPRHVELGLASRDAFIAALADDPVECEPLWLDWQGQRLPGYWLAPAGTGDTPGPTLVTTSGFDGTLEESYFQIGAAALQRGWRVVHVCGPGQMDTTRFQDDTHFVADTESWIAPWLDLALRRRGVDPGRLALMGISFGGYFAARAAAHDPRIRALVANSAVIDLHAYMASFVGMGADPEEAIPPEDDFGLDDIDGIPDAEMPTSVKEMSRSLILRFGEATFLQTFRRLRDFAVDPTLITCPALALVGTGEGEEPRRQHEAFVARATGPVSGHVFTVEDGADTHCQLGNLSYSAAVTLDWLDEVFD